jgi:response regulator of citrate/malate metabolism
VIDVVIVEDDFRVADVHADFVRQVPGFRVVGSARDAATARHMCDELAPDLALVDNYLPDMAGVQLARSIDTDFIMLTADATVATVRAAQAAGAVNYLVKPFSANQLRDRLQAYERYRSILGADLTRTMSQEQIDRARRALQGADHPSAPRSELSATAKLIARALRDSAGCRTATDLASELGIARATAQRYLSALVDTGRVEVTLRYGTTGRPENQYRWRVARDPRVS